MHASDRLVWRYAQENQMMILTANRNMKGEDSLEQVMREKIQQIRFLY
jgi:predicted nuclease of predicted toxin-antitoxin system